MRKSSLITFMLLLFSAVVAQIGDEWVNPGQSYYKLEISEQGFYRVTAAELQAAGFPVSSVPASRIQLFRRGQEVAILVQANSDGTLDYFEFYGTGNDGLSDTELYSSGSQPHTRYNLFSSAASYFVTYRLAAGSGKRMAFSADQNAVGLVPESYHLADTLQLFVGSYSAGERFGPRSEFSLSTYEEGEGWTGGFQSKNVSKDFQFQLRDIASSGPNPALESVFVGGNSLAHNISISLGPDAANLNSFSNVVFSGWVAELFQASFGRSNLSPDGGLTVRVTPEGSPGVADRASVAYMRIQYPQELNLASNENKVFTIDQPSAAKAWLQINTSNAAGTRIFDITDNYNAIRLSTTNFSQRVEVVVPNAVDQQRILAVTQFLSVPEIRSVSIPNLSFSGINYLIVTHDQLRSSGDPVAQYEIYRESTLGGGYEVLIVEVDDLYNLYSYGDPSPLAIRRFLQDALSETSIEHVFLIGKGFTPNFNYFRGDQSIVNIPAFGYPGSDLLYVQGLNGADSDLPGISIGRLNSRTPAEVKAYLDKVKEMEALPYDQLYRKDFLQLSGGTTQQEISNFAGVIQDFARSIEADFIGGKAFNTGKSTSDVVEFIDVTSQINSGVGFVTFFGHSSGSYTDIEIGRASDPAFGFANKGKYPIFLVNGCKAGEIFGNGITFGEDWMRTSDLGAIGFIAHSDVALSSGLKRWSDLYYEVAFGDEAFFGKPIGKVVSEISKRYKAQFGAQDLALTQIQQMTLQGDPAYEMFGAEFPDYEITANHLDVIPLEGEEVLAYQDSFQVQMVIRNYGRTITDSLIVRVDRLFPDGEQVSYLKEFQRPLRQDTLQFYLPLDPTKIHVGINILTVTLDPTNMAEELNEANNQATIELPIFNGNTSHLFPIDNGLRSASSINFIFQASNLLAEHRSYELEIDNTPAFNSAGKLSILLSGKVLMSENVDVSSLVSSDTTTLFWRTRFSEVREGELNEWVSTSFTIISGVPDGWGQFAPDQPQRDFIEGITYNETTNEWEFRNNSLFIDIGTFGVNHPTFSYSDLRAIVGGIDLFVTSNTLDRFCEQNTLNAIVFDRESADPYRPVLANPTDEFNREVCGRLPQRIYQFREIDLLGTGRRLQVLIDNMNNGDLIVLFSIGNLNYSTWDAEVVASLNQLGIDYGALSLTDGQPAIFFGKKGDPVGSGFGITDNNSGNPKTEQSLGLQTVVNGSFVSGQIKTRRIGPARVWMDFSYQIQEEASDAATINVNGIDAEGNVSSLFPTGRAETVDLSAVDPREFPELELVFSFSDETNQSPPQFDFWKVQYELPPEGILLTQAGTVQEVREGQDIEWNFSFLNISEVSFTDSLDVMARLVNESSGDVLERSFRIAPPAAKDTSRFIAQFPSFGQGGLNSIILEVSPNENEIYSENNRVTLPNLVNVIADETNPVLDVTFDGFHILDGDVVSPTPTISIKLRDDNPFIVKSDTTGINISLKLPGEESVFQRVNFSDPRLNYFPADENRDFEVEFRPGPLDNGVYSMSVQAADEAGNQAGTEPYEISFEVVNESTVTHFYPYPNPFSTSCRFVFTLTGSEIPDQIKIQILTVSGRVVREITQDEIGPIRIGNNITSYAWDGRDEFGDQLANGVYFYKVFINSNGDQLQQRSTSADGAFKNGFGKLYILR